MTRQQRDSSAPTERDMQWMAEANTWVRTAVPAYYERFSTGLHTVADVLVWLDSHPEVPTCWARWMSVYQTRYQMVRNACMALARDGYLETSETQNAKGRDAVAYSRVRQPEWMIAVSPSAEADVVTALVRRWLHTNRNALRNVATITITQRKQSTPDGRRTAPDRERAQ